MGIATLVNTVISFFIYIVGIGITSLVAKIIGKRFLNFTKEKDTYWSELGLGKEGVNSYYRQF